MLAKHGICGGDEERIIWELPLSRGWQYFHAALCAAGVRTVESAQNIVSEYEQIERMIHGGHQSETDA